MRELTFIEALREGIDQAMEHDPRVIVIGEGVPDPKAIFGSTAGLQQKHGPARVFDMPLSENGLTGICIGAALSGMRPLMVHQRVDFALLAMDQLVNNAAKWHYMFDGKASVPLVVRMIVGRGWGQGPQHSQSLQALFAQIPGLKVVMPTTARDAKGMLMAAIADDNPVIFIEHRWLHHVTDDVPEEAYAVPLDEARCLHAGSDVTVAAFSYMSLEALRAARVLFEHADVSVDVIDMRSIRPLDTPSVLRSLQKTGRLVIADTGFLTGSIAGELMAQVIESGFDLLKAAPVRIACPDFPAPSSPFMSDGYYPGAEQIASAVFKLLGRSFDACPVAMLEALKHSGRHDAPVRNFTGPF